MSRLRLESSSTSQKPTRGDTPVADCSARSGSSRRRFLAGTWSAVLVGLSGCSEIENVLVEWAYRDLNILNESNVPVELALTVTTDRAIILEKTVELDTSETEQYGNLWSAGEEYTISVGVAGGDTETKTLVPQTQNDPVVVTYGTELTIDHRPQRERTAETEWRFRRTPLRRRLKYSNLVSVCRFYVEMHRDILAALVGFALIFGTDGTPELGLVRAVPVALSVDAKTDVLSAVVFDSCSLPDARVAVNDEFFHTCVFERFPFNDFGNRAFAPRSERQSSPNQLGTSVRPLRYVTHNR